MVAGDGFAGATRSAISDQFYAATSVYPERHCNLQEAGMTMVVADMSMSVDGFVAGPDTDADHPLGVGGELLHRWLFADPQDPRDSEVAAEMTASVGAVVLGRRTFDIGVDIWGDVPFPAPCFVVTHRPHDERVMTSGSFTFVTGGVREAVTRARAAAGDRNVQLMGAETVQQVDRRRTGRRMQINLVPVLLGRGVRMFDALPADHVDLTRTRVIASDGRHPPAIPAEPVDRPVGLAAGPSPCHHRWMARPAGGTERHSPFRPGGRMRACRR